MLSGDDDKPAARSGQRKGKAEQPSKKGEQRSKKAAPQQKAKADSLRVARESGGPDNREQVSAPVASIDKPATSAASAETVQVNFQTVANAYGDFSRKSLEQTRSFFEKLAGVRSLDKAFELQTEFARQAYETFVAESRRIGELHGQLAAQRLKRLEGFMTRMAKPF